MKREGWLGRHKDLGEATLFHPEAAQVETVHPSCEHDAGTERQGMPNDRRFQSARALCHSYKCRLRPGRLEIQLKKTVRNVPPKRPVAAASIGQHTGE